MQTLRTTPVVGSQTPRLTSTRPLLNRFTPPIPAPTRDGRNIGACVEALKASVESLVGQRGDASNRAVTFNDLVAYGLLDPSAVQSPHGSVSFGEITGVVAGTGLSGGGSTGVVTLNLVSPVAIADGGTGASTAAAARANLGAAPLANPVFTGDPQAPTPATADNDTSIATTAFVKTNLASYATLANPVFTGDPRAPTPAPGDNDTSLATTAFVAAAIAGFAPLANPVFTGDPRAPTPAVGDSDTSIATTSFVQTAIGNVLGAYAPLASPVFTGDPRAPTPTAGDNDTSIATTAFVTGALGSYLPLVGGTITGTAPGTLTIKRTASTVPAPTGPGLWIVGNDTEAPTIDIDAFGTGSTTLMAFRVANGTSASPSATLTGHSLLNFQARGYGTTGWASAPSFRMIVNPQENFTDTAFGVAVIFATVPIGGNALVNQLTMGPGVTVGSPTALSGQTTGDLNTQRFAINGALWSAGQVPGTATNDNANAGNIGEVISALNSAGSALTSGTPLNVTSIVLTPGDWDVDGSVQFLAGGASFTVLRAWINTTSAAIPALSTMFPQINLQGTFAAAANEQVSTGTTRVSVATGTTTTVYLGAQATFSGGTGSSAAGWIIARRAR